MDKRIEKVENNLIFVVEDNEIYSMMLDYMLTKYSNCKVKRYGTAEEFLNNLHMNPDIVILDYYLPQMNGLETLKQIKDYNPEIVVVALTGQNDISVVKEMLDAGVNKYFQKAKDPVDKICKTIDSMLFNVQAKKRDQERIRSVKKIAVTTALCAFAVILLYYIFK